MLFGYNVHCGRRGSSLYKKKERFLQLLTKVWEFPESRKISLSLTLLRPFPEEEH